MCNKKVMFLSLLLLSVHASAQSLGNYGQVFPVIEEDIRHVIMRRLQKMEQDGEMARMQHKFDERVTAHITRPKPLDLTTTIAPKSFHVDPTITVNHDIYAPDGVLVAKKGMQLNPFDHIHFSKTLIFFNGDDAVQVAWVLKHYKDYQHVKFILTGGDIRDAANHFGRIYFDVGARLKLMLHIEHVPTVVNQDKRQWLVKEIGAHDA